MKTKNIKTHYLSFSVSSASKFINSIHYGNPLSGKKAYIQAGLHADEAPGYMVMHYLIELLDKADKQGNIDGEIICIPAANPIGFEQWSYDRLQGRFDISNGINFNRNYPDIIKETAGIIDKNMALSNNADDNIKVIRSAMKKAVQNIQPEEQSSELKKLLLSLSFDADIVLDLHCDNQALIHIYTGTSLWNQDNTKALAAWTGAEAILLADESGGDPYDEACSKIWLKLQALYPDYPIPPASLAATIEYRGEADVLKDTNKQDALNLYSFLCQLGYINCSTSSNTRDLPQLKAEPTPLSGVEHIKSNAAGIATFFKKPGDKVKAGDKICEVMNPYSKIESNKNSRDDINNKNEVINRDNINSRDGNNNSIIEIFSKTEGLLFSLISDRMVKPGRILAKIAGKEPIEGKGKNLLTA